MRHRGFTLIELLVVIAIIGLLSSVVLVSVNQVRAKAQNAKRISDMRQIQLAFELYHSVHGVYPNVATDECVSNGSWEAMQSALQPYLPTLPKDPAKNCATHRMYHIWSNPNDYKALAHLPDSYFPTAGVGAVLDPRRDGGSDAGTGAPGSCPGNGTHGWAYAVYSPGAECW